jgi:hypothetical protein
MKEEWDKLQKVLRSKSWIAEGAERAQRSQSKTGTWENSNKEESGARSD